VLPDKTVPIACFKPSWASEIRRRTPFNPRFDQAAQKRGPEGAVLRQAAIDAEHLTIALRGDADGDDRRLADHPAIGRAF
jgi:hypothetical protein